MDIAHNLIDICKQYGADVAKFQLYDVDRLFPDKQIMAQGQNWYNEVKQTQLSYTMVKSLYNHCERIGIEFMASVFDTERIEWCEDLRVKRYKIASRSIHDKELISALCKTGKPLIVSLGMWEDYPESVPVINAKQVDFLHCVSKYPTPLDETHIDEIDFDKITGYSDHTIGISACLVAASLGANIIEKHITFNRRAAGPDHILSADPRMLKHMILQIRNIEVIRGDRW